MSWWSSQARYVRAKSWLTLMPRSVREIVVRARPKWSATTCIVCPCASRFGRGRRLEHPNGVTASLVCLDSRTTTLLAFRLMRGNSCMRDADLDVRATTKAGHGRYPFPGREIDMTIGTEDQVAATWFVNKPSRSHGPKYEPPRHDDSSPRITRRYEARRYED